MSEHLTIESPKKNESIDGSFGYLFATGFIEPSNQFVGVSGKIVRAGTHEVVSTGMLIYYEYGGSTVWQIFFDISDKKITTGCYDLIVTSYDSKLSSVNRVIWEESVLRNFCITKSDSAKIEASKRLSTSSLLSNFSYLTYSRLLVSGGTGIVLRLTGNFTTKHPPTEVTLTPSDGHGIPTGMAIMNIKIFTIPNSQDDPVVAVTADPDSLNEALSLLWFADFKNLDVPLGNYILSLACGHFSEDYNVTIS